MTNDLDLNDIHTFLEAATQHGDQSEDDQEIGDLQTLLITAWDLMTQDQKIVFAETSAVKDVLGWLRMEEET